MQRKWYGPEVLTKDGGESRSQWASQDLRWQNRGRWSDRRVYVSQGERERARYGREWEELWVHGSLACRTSQVQSFCWKDQVVRDGEDLCLRPGGAEVKCRSYSRLMIF